MLDLGVREKQNWNLWQWTAIPTDCSDRRDVPTSACREDVDAFVGVQRGR